MRRNVQHAGETLRQAAVIVASAGLAADKVLLKETRIALARAPERAKTEQQRRSS
jgi:hypothetical protein